MTAEVIIFKIFRYDQTELISFSFRQALGNYIGIDCDRTVPYDIPSPRFSTHISPYHIVTIII